MIVDSTLLFAQRRNVPVRYNRDHVETTLTVMARVDEIRAKRERAFYKKRMAGNKERQRETDRKLVAENEHLLPRQRASERLAAEAMDVVETAAVPLLTGRGKEKLKHKMKQRMLVGGGVEGQMEVD